MACLNTAELQSQGFKISPLDLPTLGEAYLVEQDQIHDLLRALQEKGFNFLFDLFGIDTGSCVEIVYNLRRMDSYQDVSLHVQVPYGATVKSVWKIFKSALMPERELCEMFDLYLTDHPNPRRLVTTDGCPPFLLKRVPIRTGEEVNNRDDFHMDMQNLQRYAGSLAPYGEGLVDNPEQENVARPASRVHHLAVPSFGKALEQYSLSETPGSVGRAQANPDEVHTEHLLLNMGPQHPSTHGVLRVVLELDGEQVVSGEAVIGQLHRGIEKLAEHRKYNALGTLMDRGDYVSGIHCELAAAMAAEKLAGIEVPKKADYLRTLTGELNRIASHMVWFGPSALDAGMMGLFLYLWKDREDLLDILEDLTGQRMMFNYVRPGGVTGDMTPRAYRLITEFLDGFLARMDEHETFVMENEIFKSRTMGVGYISREMALQYGLTGANLRASGVEWDVRRDRPYAAYSDMKFNVPVSDTGDIYARFQVRVEELRQAALIARQCLEGLPEGPVMASMPKSFKPPKGESYACVESPRGELGVYMVSNGKTEPYRMRYRPPALYALQAGEALLPGALLADGVVALGSLDFVLGEIDR